MYKKAKKEPVPVVTRVKPVRLHPWILLFLVTAEALIQALKVSKTMANLIPI